MCSFETYERVYILACLSVRLSALFCLCSAEALALRPSALLLLLKDEKREGRRQRDSSPPAQRTREANFFFSIREEHLEIKHTSSSCDLIYKDFNQDLDKQLFKDNLRCQPR